jgi:hypothetical protein
MLMQSCSWKVFAVIPLLCILFLRWDEAKSLGTAATCGTTDDKRENGTSWDETWKANIEILRDEHETRHSVFRDPRWTALLASN